MKDAKTNSTASKAKATAEKSTVDKSTVSANALQSAKAQSGTAVKQDAEAFLKADHRKVEQLFQQYKNAGEDSDQKLELAEQVCKELIVHSKLEEELFYPACRQKDVEDDTLDEAQVEHDGAKIMIAELMKGSPDDDYYDAKLTVLSEYIKHHVGEEEKPGDGIFAKARKSGVDMNALGVQLQARKAELMANIEALSSRPPQPRSLKLTASSETNQEKSSMARYSNDRDRDEQGRFMSEDDDNRYRSSSRSGYSSRGNRGYDYDDGRGNGRRSSSSSDRDDQGRFMSNDDNGRSNGRWSSSSNDRERDDQGRFMSDDDNGRGNGRRSSSFSDRERDDQGRFMSDDDNGRGRRSSGSNNRDRDGYGRFTSDDKDNRYRSSSSGGYSFRSSRDDDDDRGGRSSSGRGQGGWFGDSQGHSEAAERGWEGRESSRGGYSSRSSRDDDDDRGGRSSGSGSGPGGQGHGGWFGDSEGHSEAAERGWENRQSSRGGYSSSSRRSSHDDDDDDRGGRSSRARSSQGHGGWFGDSRGHAEAARKGWQDR